MKTISKALIVVLLFTGFTFSGHAQQRKGNLEVTTQLKETNGSYDQRKLYREFLISYMKNCPYISNFNIRETTQTSDNHDVTWSYDVNSWDDITKFYGWVESHLKPGKNGGLKKAMTPYQPDYAIGGKIQVHKAQKGTLAKD